MAYPPFYSSFTPPFSSTIPPPSPTPYGYAYSVSYNHEQQPPLPYSQLQPPPSYSPTPCFSHGYTPPSLNQYTPFSNPYTPLASLYSQSQPPPPSSPPPLYSPPLPCHSTYTPPPNPIEPVSFFQNTGSYIGSASYSNPYYNPPYYYQNNNVYGTPATVWNNYSSFSSHPDTSSASDSNRSVAVVEIAANSSYASQTRGEAINSVTNGLTQMVEILSTPFLPLPVQPLPTPVSGNTSNPPSVSLPSPPMETPSPITLQSEIPNAPKQMNMNSKHSNRDEPLAAHACLPPPPAWETTRTPPPSKPLEMAAIPLRNPPHVNVTPAPPPEPPSPPPKPPEFDIFKRINGSFAPNLVAIPPLEAPKANPTLFLCRNDATIRAPAPPPKSLEAILSTIPSLPFSQPVSPFTKESSAATKILFTHILAMDSLSRTTASVSTPPPPLPKPPDRTFSTVPPPLCDFIIVTNTTAQLIRVQVDSNAFPCTLHDGDFQLSPTFLSSNAQGVLFPQPYDWHPFTISQSQPSIKSTTRVWLFKAIDTGHVSLSSKTQPLGLSLSSAKIQTVGLFT